MSRGSPPFSEGRVGGNCTAFSFCIGVIPRSPCSAFREFQGYRLPTDVEAGNFFGTGDYFPFYIADVSEIAICARGGLIFLNDVPATGANVIMSLNRADG